MVMSLLLLLLAAQSSAAAAPPEPSADAATASADSAPADWAKDPGTEPRVRDPQTGEFPVEPYAQSDVNAGARPFTGTGMADAFGGQDGIRRITARTVELSENDPRIAEIFVNQDLVRLRRTLFEQFCYILNAGCRYSGRNMKEAHKNMGLRRKDLNALVENLQLAMREAAIPFAVQNRLLARLAPMDRQMIER